MSEFALDDKGESPTKPLTSWKLGHVTGLAALLLELEYAETPEELQTEDRHTLCLALPLPVALRLADALRKCAEGFQNQTGRADTQVH